MSFQYWARLVPKAPTPTTITTATSPTNRPYSAESWPSSASTIRRAKPELCISHPSGKARRVKSLQSGIKGVPGTIGPGWTTSKSMVHPDFFLGRNNAQIGTEAEEEVTQLRAE